MKYVKCQLCGENRETLQHLFSGCKKQTGLEYVKSCNITLKGLVVKWAIEDGFLLDKIKWYARKVGT